MTRQLLHLRTLERLTNGTSVVELGGLAERCALLRTPARRWASGILSVSKGGLFLMIVLRAEGLCESCLYGKGGTSQRSGRFDTKSYMGEISRFLFNSLYM